MFWRFLASLASPHHGSPRNLAIAIQRSLDLPHRAILTAIGVQWPVKHGKGDGLLSRLSAALRQHGNEMLRGGLLGGESNLKSQYRRFSLDFPPLKTGPEDQLVDFEPSELPLTPAGRSRRLGQANLFDRENRKAEARDRREARRLAGIESRRLYKDGYQVSEEKRQDIEKQIFGKLTGARLGGGKSGRQRAADLREEVRRSDKQQAPRTVGPTDQQLAEWQVEDYRKRHLPVGSTDKELREGYVRDYRKRHARARDTDQAAGREREKEPAETESFDKLTRALEQNIAVGEKVYAALTGSASRMSRSG